MPLPISHLTSHRKKFWMCYLTAEPGPREERLQLNNKREIPLINNTVESTMRQFKLMSSSLLHVPEYASFRLVHLFLPSFISSLLSPLCPPANGCYMPHSEINNVLEEESMISGFTDCTGLQEIWMLRQHSHKCNHEATIACRCTILRIMPQQGVGV